MIKTFFYVEFVGLLALLRVFSASGSSRLAALLAFCVALIGIAAKYVPPLAGLMGTDLARYADHIVNSGVLRDGSGMALPLVVSLLFAVSAFLPGRRWWALDFVFAIAATGFWGLYVYTLL